MKLLWFNLAMQREDPVLAFAVDWVNQVAGLVSHVDVVTMKAGSYEVRENVSVYSAGKEMGYSEPRRAIEFYRILGSLLKSNHYDACFVHMITVFAAMGAPLLKVWGIPVTLWYAHKSITPRLRLAEKWVDRIVTPSRESFRIPSPKVIITGHGIDTDKFVPAPAPRAADQPFTITSVGRIAPIKHLEILIEATRILVQECHLERPLVRLVGNVYPHDTAYAQQLHRQVEACGLEDVVQFTGPVPFEKIVSEYQRADVVVNLSDTDSVDKAVLEAMSCQVPVVTSNSAFERRKSSVKPSLTVPKQNPADLADRLSMLASQSLEERRELERQLRQIVVENHSLKGLARKLVFDVVVT